MIRRTILYILRKKKRKWLMTIFEILIPILLFYLITYVVGVSHILGFNSKSPNVKSYEQEIIPPRSLSDVFLNGISGLRSIDTAYYTPSNNLTDSIMKEVQKLIVKPLFVPISNESMIFTMSSEFFRKFGIVFMYDTTHEACNLKYKILDSYNYKIPPLFPVSERDGPMHRAEDYFNGYLGIQLAIDKSLIYLCTRQDTMNFSNIYIQPFPYPSYTSTNEDISIIEHALSIITVISFAMICVSLLKHVVEEKQSGVKELQKLMGLKNWMIWIGWLINIVVVYMVSVTYIVALLKFNGEQPVLQNSNAIIIWVFLILSCAATIFFCFALSTLFEKPMLAMIFGLIIWITSYSMLVNVTDLEYISLSTKLLLCLLPNVAIKFGFKVITYFESQSVGIQWSLIFNAGGNETNLSLAMVMTMLVVDCLFYSVITWYIDAIHPGKYGIAKPFNFICSNLFSNKNDMCNDYELNNHSDTKYFEKPPSDLKVGISIQSLRKHFGKVEAVRHFNLKIYKGEITALLGHNGAGKTTAMNIITGIISPTSGNIYYEGLDVFKNINKFRQSIGICPQHNLHFSFLSVMEHMVFFGMLKGASYREARIESLQLLQTLHIDEKANSLVSELSGGMKRKLSLAIALVGNPKILMLDEPTSGIDVESRRLMWDLLLNMRGNRTILLTTHYMEEADVLGDRIAIMDHGYITCHGTTLFLKRIFGTGYHVTLLKKSEFDASKTTQLIKQIISDAEILEDSDCEIVYGISSNHLSLFPKLFSSLEAKLENLGINGMGVSYTTMEEVFVKAGKISEQETASPSSVLAARVTLSNGKTASDIKVSGLHLLVQQILILCLKKYRYTVRNWFTLLVVILYPILSGIITIKVSNWLFLVDNDVQVFTISLSAYGNTEVIVRNSGSKFLIEDFYKKYVEEQSSSVILTKEDLVQTLLNAAKNDIIKYRSKMISAAIFDKENDTIFYNTISHYSIPTAINLYTVSLLRATSGMKNSFISTMIQPLTERIKDHCYSKVYTPAYFLWSLIFLGFVTFSTYFLIFPQMERVTGIKHIQMMSNLSPVIYWIALFFSDFLLYILITAITLLGMIFADSYNVFAGVEEMSVAFCILSLYGINVIIYSYVFSYIFKNINTCSAMFVILNVIINIIAIPVFDAIKAAYLYTAENPIPDIELKTWYVVLHGLLLLPPFNLLSCFVGYFTIMWNNIHCLICPSTEPNVKCEVKTMDYFVFSSKDNVFGILTEIVFFIASILLFTSILILLNYDVFGNLWNRLLTFIYKPDVKLHINEDGEDSDIQKERDRINDIKKHQIESNLVLVGDNLIKNYIKRFRKFTAVDGVNFTVSKGECFGLLGVNGAGKSSTFKMLTAELLPSSGDACIYNYKLSNDKNAYLSKVGYCPQENNIIKNLTGKEMLELLCLLRGVHPNNVKHHVDKWTSILGLQEYCNKQCGTYSGGNKRKLCTAMSLIGDPDVIFLDEPTSGVDPVSRRNLYDVMKSSKSQNQAVVLTSHSMEECEILCDRLTIMAAGQMKCIGSPQYLKQRYARGFTIMIKLQEFNDNNEQLLLLKNDMNQQFKGHCILKDEHKGLLHYEITDPSYEWSYLFETMEKLSNSNSIITEYTIGDTTLEQVFLSIAKICSNK